MMSPLTEAPFFTGIAISTWSSSLRYRVYTFPGELVFIYAGSGGDIERAIGVQFGAIGGLITAAVMSKKKKRQEERLAALSFDELVASHKRNFRAASTDLSECKIDPRSFWTATSCPGVVAGIFRFTHAEKGKFTLCIESVNDMKTAVEQVPISLGSQVAINVEWSPKKKAFCARP
jgi:hypothetical protein